MTTDAPTLDPTETRQWLTPIRAALLAATLALVVALPTTDGGFLSGDDYNLIRDHVLVNRPSLRHAVELFRINHRDLYQPIPLLSFSFNFAILNALDLDPVREGPRAGLWTFHLTNGLVHAINAALVCLVIRRLSQDTRIALVAALIFAVHPLMVESIAWLNGRFMMLSAMGTLITLILLDRYNDSGRLPTAIALLATAALAHMSKISVALPALAFIFPLIRKRRPNKHFYPIWAALALMTLFFTVTNIRASEEMFLRAEKVMDGPPILYVTMALAQYVRHFLLPIGLSPWYPPPSDLEWTEPRVVSAIVTVLLVITVAAIAYRKAPTGAWGLLWFFAAVAPTLPFVAVRKSLAADRYTYLPIVGLAWIAATLLIALHTRLKRHAIAPSAASEVAAPAIATIILAAFTAASLHLQSFYDSNIISSLRIIQCFPDEPGVYESAAWAYYREGQYEQALQIAPEDLKRHPQARATYVWQVVGMSQFRLGHIAAAVQSLNKAIAADPEFGKCYSRLGQILAAKGDLAEAIKNYEKAVEIMPFYNPGWTALARLYEAAGDTQNALRAWNETLINNKYDPNAHIAIAIHEIQTHQLTKAIDRLENLLKHLPDNPLAHANLALAYDRSGNTSDAMRHYNRAIQLDPTNAIPALNLANLRLRAEGFKSAHLTYKRLIENHPNNLTLLIAFHDAALAAGSLNAAVEPFNNASEANPNDPRLRIWSAYTLAQTNNTAAARTRFNAAPTATVLDLDVAEIHAITHMLIALQSDNPESAAQVLRSHLYANTPPSPNFANRLLNDLQRHAAQNPNSPWPYYLSAQLLTAQNRPDLAARARAEFTRLCHTDSCKQLIPPE